MCVVHSTTGQYILIHTHIHTFRGIITVYTHIWTGHECESSLVDVNCNRLHCWSPTLGASAGLWGTGRLERDCRGRRPSSCEVSRMAGQAARRKRWKFAKAGNTQRLVWNLGMHPTQVLREAGWRHTEEKTGEYRTIEKRRHADTFGGSDWKPIIRCLCWTENGKQSVVSFVSCGCHEPDCTWWMWGWNFVLSALPRKADLDDIVELLSVPACGWEGAFLPRSVIY